MATVTNKHYEEYDVYIGRGSIWGNPYSHREGTKADFRVDTVDEAIRSYRVHLWKLISNGTITIDMLKALHGKRLGCFCSPRPCHGDVIKAAVEWAMSK